MQTPTIVLTCFAALSFSVLPYLSARQVVALHRKFWKTYLRTLALYFSLFLIIEAGYTFQGSSTGFYFPGQIFSGLEWAEFLIKTTNSIADIPLVLLDACAICFVALTANDGNQRAIRACRCAFVVFTVGDIVIDVIGSGRISDYIVSIAFNFIGAIVCGPLTALLANRFVPADKP